MSVDIQGMASHHPMKFLAPIQCIQVVGGTYVQTFVKCRSFLDRQFILTVSYRLPPGAPVQMFGLQWAWKAPCLHTLCFAAMFAV